MNFDFDSNQKSLQSEMRRFLEQRSPVSEVRTVLDGKRPFQESLWSELGEMGYTGVAIDECYGGTGLGYLELCLISEELGRTLAAVPYSSTVYIFAEALKEAGTEEQKQKWLPKIAKAQTVACFALEEGAGSTPLQKIKTRYADGAISGVKKPVVDGQIADVALVVARDDETENKCSLFIVDLTDETRFERTQYKSLDPTRSLASLNFKMAPADRLGVPGSAEILLSCILDRAAVFAAFEQIGGAEKALWMARDYSLERFAFGRPIGSFQAIQHMMADMYAATVLARSNAYYGVWALATQSDDLGLAAANARVSATQSYQLCARDAIHIHGGMGFTWEFDCHLHYRRSNFLAVQYGSLSQWEDRLVRQLCASDGVEID